MKTIVQAISIVLLSIYLLSCKTDNSRMAEAKKITESFMDDIIIEDQASANNYYPKLKNLTRFWRVKSYSFKKSKIEKEVVTVYGEITKRDNSKENIVFVLKENEDDDYIIIKSIGLFAYDNFYLYAFLKNIGCIKSYNSDVEVSDKYARSEYKYNQLINKYKYEIENIISNSTYAKRGYGYISGDITIINNSKFDIPSLSYDLYIDFTDKNHEIVRKEKSYSSVLAIPSGGSIKTFISSHDERRIEYAGPRINIINTEFIEEYLAYNKDNLTCNDF
jgi:hypothetical protein